MRSIVVTGAAGFIGSCLISKLNHKGIVNIIAVDDFSKPAKELNYKNKTIAKFIHRNEFIDWFSVHSDEVAFVFHLGARTDTTEFDVAIFDVLNLNYSKSIFNICAEKKIPMLYASSAATYGMGENGYDDNQEYIVRLKPLNPYGESKHNFDKWALRQVVKPPFWAGLKFFNVFGPNEFHKGRMASVVFHAFNQINESGKVKLFRSHKPEYPDGGQMRDFIYVKDVIDVCYFLYMQRQYSGIYNLGSGIARSFKDLVNATFTALNKPVNIEFIDTPEDIREKYQYFTEANMSKLRKIGYNVPFYTLEDAVMDYVQGYLVSGSRY